MVSLIRRRYWRLGLLRGEWWIGVRRDFQCDWWHINVLGLSLVLTSELFCAIRQKLRRRTTPTSTTEG